MPLLSVNSISHSVDWLRSGRQDTRLCVPAASFWCVEMPSSYGRSVHSRPGWQEVAQFTPPCGRLPRKSRPAEAGTRDPGPGGSPLAACHLGVHSDPQEAWAISFLSLPPQAQVTEVREAWHLAHFRGK